jgi:heat-inducible transcriptional repressor
MEHCTLISIPYQISENETGTIALIGPNRMPYNKVIPLLEYVALNLGKLYKK